ncbi:PREDICTED: probable xyloglucan galactosyltransferase GT11 [Camelina sativa]|uniref:Probable xyloglucan galactosyltransferase GT11 n=1 Tax=Camelina sativa TaxID=90675 RepID=A0ABM0SQ14_CAMSA|nr:PREDICTED: probable xyloglucan galactosyltransferase GT11 [Camelina sativa]
MRKPKRRGGTMAMEKSSSKYRTQFWYVAMASFLLWLVLLYLFSSSAKTVHNHERLFRQENIIDLPVENVPQNNESDEAPVVVSEDISVDNSSLPVSVDSSPVDQMSEDKKVVADLVEELEKERVENEKKRVENEKKRADSGIISGRSSRARRGHRESRKARSSGRVEADTKRVRHNDDEETKVENSDQENHQSSDKEPNFFESKNYVEPKKEQVDDNDDDFVNKGGKELENDGSSNDLQGDNTSEIVSQPKTQRNYASNNNTSKAKSRVDSKRNQPKKDQKVTLRPMETIRNDPCKEKYVYMHEVPSLFNEELLKNCWTLSRWTDMCELTSNFGLGPRLPNVEGVSGWYATNQFTLEVIFHNRMKQYKCLTKDSSLASAVFVPYYPGLDLMRFLWGPFPSMRDAAALDLMKWLRESREWKRMNGRDHFMVAGRTTWDFMRTPENESDWGNRLMILPEVRNMTMLLIESSPWNYHGFAVPYPTYFHPSTYAEIIQWQMRMRRINRRYLFSFVGAPRPNLGDSIRTEIMDQCKASKRKCKLLECVSGSQKCYKPDQIMKFFLSSTFCLQPPGDSYTRRSTFDSILAGCIPVFFHPGSAYAQYIWHLPKDIGKYSVFIPEKTVKEGKVSIENVLSRIPRTRVFAMREQVIRLIPRLMYFNPSSKSEDTGRFEDAFDVAVEGVLQRVEGLRKRIEEGNEEIFDFPEKYSWKYNVFGNVEKHEWDSYFDRP